MNLKYNITVNAVNAALKVYAHCLPAKVHRKFPEFVKGRISLIKLISEEMLRDTAEDNASEAPVIWVHASSLGEFGIARPLIAELKKKLGARIVLTFFSPSGYRVLSADRQGVDHVFYLPLDTKKNVRGFLDAVKPSASVFMVSEYWPNMLQELKFRSIPTFLVSAIIRDNAPFFRWYGRIFRKSLSAYRRFFVLDKHSLINLRSLGYENAELTGDPLFDNVAIIADTPWTDSALERFTAYRTLPVFIGGSISDEQDLRITSEMVNSHPDLKAILVPHDVDEKTIHTASASLTGTCIRHSQITEDTDLSHIQTIIIDSVGKLAYIYRYGTMAYIGGGFTPLLHSVIEATVYGLPVSFGPRTERKITPSQLIELGIGTKIHTAEELSRWVDSFTPDSLTEIKEKCRKYVESNIGSTQKIVNTIAGYI